MAFALVLGQWSPGVILKLERQEDPGKFCKERDLLGLLKFIQGICCKFETNTRPFWMLTQAKKGLYLFWQEKGVLIEKYRGYFNAYVERRRTSENCQGPKQPY